MLNNSLLLSQNPKSHTEESPSEISGETIPSDSGHGGSEEDFNSHNHNNNMGKYLTSPPMDSNTSTYFYSYINEFNTSSYSLLIIYFCFMHILLEYKKKLLLLFNYISKDFFPCIY